MRQLDELAKRQPVVTPVGARMNGFIRQQVTPGDQFVAAQAEAEHQMRLAAEKAKAERLE